MSPQELRERRQKLGMSQTELAQLLGYTRNGLAKLEAGRAPIKPALDFATRYLLEHPEACGGSADRDRARASRSISASPACWR
ncbi:MAG TPA: helix-turn-helix domain-containing protein [Stellaceae bacterium]|nr:helix-turn-helix domain-containing protein [Stellaceae bacterium]